MKVHEKNLNSFTLKRKHPFAFSFEMCLIWFYLLSTHELFSNQSLSVLVVYRQYLCVYLGFLQTELYSILVKAKGEA